MTLDTTTSAATTSADTKSDAMTLDEARLMANVNARAQALFENGYRARWRAPHLLAVRNGQGTVYDVDTLAGTCNCPFFTKSIHPCKHVLGWRKLLGRQRTCRLWITLALLRVWSSLDDVPRKAARPADAPDRMLGNPGDQVLGDGSD